MGDVLFPVRNLFYLGAHQSAINEAQDLTSLSELDAVARDVFVYRSYVALGSSQLVISEIPDDSAQALQAVKLYAEYKAGAKSKEDCAAKVKEWMADDTVSANSTACVISALILTEEGSIPDALRACSAGTTLEMQAVMVQLYLLMDRHDYAEKTVKAMSAVDDDATLTQLAIAWTGLAMGGSKAQEAAYAFQELGDKYTWTAMLHNGVAAANMRMLRWEEAETELQDALRKDDKDPEALANLIAVCLHLGKPYRRYINQLKMQHPEHPFVQKWEASTSQISNISTDMKTSAGIEAS